MDGIFLGTFVDYDSFLLCTSFIPFVSRWRELDLGHNTSTEMCGRMAEL
jgi:hypothetical protein